MLCSPAQARNASATMPVTALTVETCAVVALPMAFGTLNQLGGTASDSQTNVTVTCTPGVSYNVGLDMGANAMGGVRRMAAALGGEAVPYALYTNASRTTAWGNTVGTNTVAGTASLLPSTLTVYGRVGGDAGLVPAGVYADLVTVTVTF
jgi:spore coat protein U-like protein